MQLEWRALRRAVESSESDRAEAIADALAFRRERRRLFPGAAVNERREEIREGLAAYTGIAALGSTLQGDGWSVTLNAGWVVQPAARPGSFTIVPAGRRDRRSDANHAG